MYEVVEKLGPVCRVEDDQPARIALTKALVVTHKTLHKLLKPDELAEGRAVASARKNDLAADQNAQSIVIHPLHRQGAPGPHKPRAATAGRAVSAGSKEGAE